MFQFPPPSGRKRSSHRKPMDAVAGPVFAELEPRLLMSGDISIRESGINLMLRGDRFDNSLEITEIAANQFQFTGLNGTTIGGQNSVVRTVTGQLTINTGTGNDSLNITQSLFNKLKINMGKGSDQLTMGDVTASRMLLSGGKGRDTLFDQGANSLATKVRSFEIDRFPDSAGDSFAQVTRSQSFSFLLGQGQSFTFDETQSERFITDYHITRDRRGKTRVMPVYTDFFTGLKGTLLAQVTPDRQQVIIEARLVQTEIDSVNQLGINTPLGMRYIDQPVYSTLNFDTTLTLPDGATFEPGQSERTEGPIASESSIFIRPTIVDTNPSITQKNLQVEIDLGTLNRSADSQSLKADRANLNFSNFASQLKFLAGDGVSSRLSYTTERLLSAGYESTQDKIGNQTLDTFSSGFTTGLELGLTSSINTQRDTIGLNLDAINSLLADVAAKPVQTALGKQFIQLPIIDSLRVQTQVAVPDGQTILLGDIVTPGSRNPRDNMQVLITPRIVEIGNSLLTELGLRFDSTTPNQDDGRRISATLASGTDTLLTGQTDRLILSDIFSTFEPGGGGSMKTITSPLITGWNYHVRADGSRGSRLTGQVTFTETALDQLHFMPYGSRFGVQNIQMAVTSTHSVQNKVPIVSDLPVLGGFFRGNQTKTQSTLLVFITPRIVSIDTELD